MIKVILKYILYMIFFCYMLVVFLPKINLYYLALNKLESYKISLISQKVNDNYLSLDLEDLSINYDNINVSKVKRVSISTYLYNTSINIKDIKADDMLKNFIPESIQEVEIFHTVLDPLKIKLKASFKKGRAFGEVDLVNNTIVLNFDVTNTFMHQYKSITRQFKKNGKYYTYEYKY